MAPPRRTARDYDGGITAASRTGLAEIMTTLGAYRDALVLIGGWAPYLILERFGDPTGVAAFAHVGSIDIDFVVDPEIIGEAQYATIVQRLTERGYRPTPDSLFQFERTIRSPDDQREYLVRVDFLAPQPLRGQGSARRHRAVQPDLRARTLPGAEVALGHWFWYDLEAALPDGAAARVQVKAADLVSSLALKGIAIGERYAEKDAYDIYALCAYYRGGPRAVADAVRPALGEPPVRQGLGSLAQRFRALDAEGPTWVARFLGEGAADQEARVRQDAFMTVGEVCRLLGFA
jgi:hypothetical protein